MSRTTWTAVRVMAVLTVLLGVVYPALITGIGQLAFHSGANGSMLRDASGRPVGSALIGQSFSDPEGNPLPRYFQPRPSAGGYDGASSGGSNLGPESTQLAVQIVARIAQIAAFNGVPESQVPPDAVTASGSGLDPDISPQYASIQVNRVAGARGLSVEAVRALVAQHTRGPDLGYIGQPRVNVVTLNLALDGR
ncbi:MAG: potassium-transporting ATPase subunit KdpC [Frankiaceae bacterium]|nr:potassium-transporting ATPase subunit KdpC [Frankiaceae bacterium]